MIESTGPDENTLVMPDDWLRARHPRRDRPGVPEPPATDPSAPEKARAFVASVRADIETVLDLSGTAPDVAAAARACLRGEQDPLGAAALWHIAASMGGSREWAEPRPDFPFADALVAEHGVAFAAHAFTELAGLVGAGPAHRGVYGPRRRNPGELYESKGFGRDVARSLRTRLAAAPDDVYADAGKRLEGTRGHDWQRALASYLLPTREDWVEDLCANPGRLGEYGFGNRWLLFCAFGRPHQPAASGLRFGHYEAVPDCIATLIEAIGPAAVVPLLTQALQGRYADDSLILRVLASLPVDEAFQALLARIGDPDAARTLPDAAREFPARAIRLLSASAAPLGRDLLAARVRAAPDVAANVAPELPAGRRKTVEALLRRFPQATGLPPLLTEPPWTRPREKAAPVVRKGLPLPGTRAIRWAPGERDAWAAQEDTARWDRQAAGRDFAETAAKYRAQDRYGRFHEQTLLLRGPADLVRPLLEGWTVDDDHDHGEDHWTGWLGPLAARHGADAHDVVLALARRYPAKLGPYAMPLLSDEFARTMADWLVRLKSAGRTARAWFDRHGHAAAPSLLPDALGKAGPARRAAEAALRLIADRPRPGPDRRGGARPRRRGGGGDRGAAGHRPSRRPARGRPGRRLGRPARPAADPAPRPEARAPGRRRPARHDDAGDVEAGRGVPGRPGRARPVRPGVAGRVRVGAVPPLGVHRSPARREVDDRAARADRRRRHRPAPHPGDPGVAGRQRARQGGHRTGRPDRDRHRHGPDAPELHRAAGEVPGHQGAGAGQDRGAGGRARTVRRAARGPARPGIRPGRGGHAHARLRSPRLPHRFRRAPPADGRRCGRQTAQVAPQAGRERRPRAGPRRPQAVRDAQEGRADGRVRPARPPRTGHAHRPPPDGRRIPRVPRRAPARRPPGPPPGLARRA
nr:hypothetical protein [Actinomadura sp. CNU-125]